MPDGVSLILGVVQRPLMRLGTAELAAMVASGADDLSVIAAELRYRERLAARRLLADVLDRLSKARVEPEQREVVVSPAAKVAPKAGAAGDTPKQRAAWARLSEARQDHMRRLGEWREQWRQWRYFGGEEPGERPVDTTSAEAAEMVRREREADEAEAVRLADLQRRWGGDAAAREAAARSAPERKGGETVEQHMKRIRQHMANAAAKARARAAMAEG